MTCLQSKKIKHLLCNYGDSRIRTVMRHPIALCLQKRVTRKKISLFRFWEIPKHSFLYVTCLQ